MKKNYVKILTVFLCMVSLVVMLALPCFADTIQSDQTLRLIIDYNQSGGYDGGLSISPNSNVYVKYTQNDNVIYDAIAYYVDISESALGINIMIFQTADDYDSLIPTVNYSSVSDFGRAVFDFTGITSFTVPALDFVSYEVLIPDSPVVGGIIGVFSNISGFAVSALGIAQGLFYDGSSLTLIGSLSLVGVSIAIVLAIVSLVKSYLHLRG